MPDITIPGILLRTTSDGPGHVHGLAVANGLTLDQALATLAAQAAARASEIAAAYRGGLPGPWPGTPQRCRHRGVRPAVRARQHDPRPQGQRLRSRPIRRYVIFLDTDGHHLLRGA
jgi:hypothetical protein